jgi:hypothetical protein
MNFHFLQKCIARIPVDFEHISAKKFIDLTGVIFSLQSDARKKMHALMIFLNWRAVFFKDYELVETTNLTEWIFSGENKTERVIIPYVGSFLRRYYGPKMQLHNIKWGVFRNVSDYFEMYEKMKEIRYLNSAIALLYPAKNFEKHKDYVNKLPVIVRLAIYWNWILMINYLAATFPYVFGKSKKKQSKKLHLWYEFMNEWLEFKAEDFEKKDNLPAMEVLSSLNLQIKRAKEKEKEQKKKN